MIDAQSASESVLGASRGLTDRRTERSLEKRAVRASLLMGRSGDRIIVVHGGATSVVQL
jgi:hypothetical protein